ncbi:MAG TPA: chalcone isomerase family protein [Burkholderiaceae bacterium]|nr:chalcone isomerase family protein [Burkholderiaceae bacterium]
MTKWQRALIVGLGSLAAAVSVSAQPLEVEGQKFEPTVQVGGQTLNLNGVGLRKRAIFKVYVAGLYVSQKSTNAAAVIADKGARRVSLRMLRDVDAGSFIDSFNDGLKNNLSEAQLTPLKSQIDALAATLKSIGEAKKGDAINFDYTPEGGTRISVNGQPHGDAIAGADFFSAVLRIWLGEKPADESLKKGMLGA